MKVDVNDITECIENWKKKNHFQNITAACAVSIRMIHQSCQELAQLIRQQIYAYVLVVFYVCSVFAQHFILFLIYLYYTRALDTQVAMINK